MFDSLIVPWPRRSLKISCSLSLSCENIDFGGTRAVPKLNGARRRVPLQPYFFGFAVGVAAGDGAPAVSSIPNVQWASTFLSPDFAVRITVQLLSRSFCVT